MSRVVLCILDGFGWSKESNDNAIINAHTPFFDKVLNSNKNICLLEASCEAVGLPAGQVGNSEIGHMTIGAGRIIVQGLPIINNAIKDHKLEERIRQVIPGCEKKVNCHLIGLISEGGVHASRSHLLELARICASMNYNIIIHAITDGRDAHIKNAIQDLQYLKDYNIGTIHGRYYAMDRNNALERTRRSINALLKMEGQIVDNFEEYIFNSYNKGIYDEYIIPAIHKDYIGMQEQDIIICTHFREDRVKQIMGMIIEHTNSLIYSMTSYGVEFDKKITSIFDKQVIHYNLSEIISKANLRQLKIAESEKYPHVTYFFNGGIEKSLPLEDRIFIPSPNVSKYDECPAMSAQLITEQAIEAIQNHLHHFICINYANADMVGHCGNYAATIKAIEFLDKYCQELYKQCQASNYDLLITSDHGNAELCMIEGVPHTAHTTNCVPFIYLGKKGRRLNTRGSLADIAPTILQLLCLEKPQEMTGNTLFIT